jgi:hypothetical protein
VLFPAALVTVQPPLLRSRQLHNEPRYRRIEAGRRLNETIGRHAVQPTPARDRIEAASLPKHRDGTTSARRFG